MQLLRCVCTSYVLWLNYFAISSEAKKNGLPLLRFCRSHILLTTWTKHKTQSLSFKHSPPESKKVEKLNTYSVCVVCTYFCSCYSAFQLYVYTSYLSSLELYISTSSSCKVCRDSIIVYNSASHPHVHTYTPSVFSYFTCIHIILGWRCL